MAEPNQAQSGVDNPLAAALGRLRGARAVAVVCAVVLVSGLVAAYRAGDDSSVRMVARRQAFKVGDSPGESSGVPAGDTGPSQELVLPPGDPLPGALAQALARPTATTAASTPGSAATVAAPTGPLASGTYAFSIVGSETATGFGTRQLPARAAVTARPAGGDRARLDLNLSPQHQEHFVLAYGEEGVGLVSEGSAVTFGPVAQASEFDVAPAVVEVPVPLKPHTTRGTAMLRSRGGAPSRQEDWTTSVISEETLAIGSESVPVWVIKVERLSRPGASEVNNRSSTFWYDPVRRMWVKWRERLHVERKSLGVPSTYDLEYAASFAGFNPG